MHHCHQVSISSRFRYTRPYANWGHDLDLSGSRDVNSHLAIWLAMSHFLLWSFCPKSLSLTVSEIFCPKHHVLIDSMLNRHCACAISRDVYPIQNLSTYSNFSSALCLFSMPLLLGSDEVQKFVKFRAFMGSGDQGVWKVKIFTAKGTSLRESTSSEAFCVKIASDLQRWAGKSHS